MEFNFVGRDGKRRTIKTESIEDCIIKTSVSALEEGYDLKEITLHPEIFRYLLSHIRLAIRVSEPHEFTKPHEFTIATPCGVVTVGQDHRQSREQVIFRVSKNDGWVVEVEEMGFVEGSLVFEKPSVECGEDFVKLLKEIG